MDKILVHIGLHKTGTTWLQNELFTDTIDIFEPLYIENTLNGHSTLAEHFIFDSHRNLLSPFDLNKEEILKHYEIIMNHKKGSHKMFVMSHERLSGHPSSSGFDAANICTRIKNIFPSAKILIVIREQTACITSNYFQYLKEGGVMKIENFLDYKYDGRKPGCGLNYFKYHYLIEGYIKKFGANNVLVMPYELFKSNKSKFIQNLLDFSGNSNSSLNLNLEIFYNQKENQYFDYHLRPLNNYIYSSSSLNNAEHKHVYKKKKIALGIKKIANRFSTAKWNENIKRKVSEEVEIWSKDKFIESNQITSSLIKYDLKKFGYKI